MNIIKYELKRNFKVFIFWMIGLFSMAAMGMYKYEAFATSGADINNLLASMPKIVMVILGMNELSINTLDGYYGVLFLYILIMGVLYAIHLGFNATALEVNDKTSEFIYTKPISRLRILLMKNITGVTYILLFCIFSYLFSIFGISLIGEKNDTNSVIILLNISMFILSIFYYSVASFFGSIGHKKGGLYANLFFLITFIIGIVYDLTEKSYIKLFSPLKYFDITSIVNKTGLNIKYILFTSLLILIINFTTYKVMIKKDFD